MSENENELRNLTLYSDNRVRQIMEEANEKIEETEEKCLLVWGEFNARNMTTERFWKWGDANQKTTLKDKLIGSKGTVLHEQAENSGCESHYWRWDKCRRTEAKKEKS